jgi:rhodanese-related sulfurtransferase
MKNFLRIAILIAFLPAVILTSCKEDEPEPNNDAYATLSSYMAANSLDMTDMLHGGDWVIDAKLTTDGGIVDPADNSIPAYHIFDIRSAADFATGHIKGAINVPLADVVTTAANYADKPILVVCYTGQTAALAVMALRLSGYMDAKVMKWGMSIWNDTFAGPWNSNSGDNGNIAVGSPNWVTTASPALGSYSFPTLTSSSTDGAEILAERVDYILTTGFKGVASADVLANPSGWDIINYWSEADYTTFGHFDGAYQMATIALADDAVKAFDPAKETLVYCYTGQTSAFACAWLSVLGYNVKSVKFGVNSLSYDALKAAAKPAFPGAKAYTYETK